MAKTTTTETSTNTIKFDPNSKEALEESLKALNKAYEGKVFIAGADDCVAAKVNLWVPTGIAPLDYYMSKGKGIPCGRHIEIVGHEATAKTSLALHIAGQFTKAGYNVAYIDMEHALDLERVRLFGVDLDKMIITQPDTGEEAISIAESSCRSNAYRLIIIDSVAALVPQAELEGDVGDSNMGKQAKLMSQAMRKLGSLSTQTNTAVIWINQYRQKLTSYGDPNNPTGGVALKYGASIRLQVSKGDFKGDKESPIGFVQKIKFIKNKIFTPYRTCELDFYFESGFDPMPGLVDLATARGILTRGGSWYSYGDNRIGQGRENAAKFLVEYPDIAKEIMEKTCV